MRNSRRREEALWALIERPIISGDTARVEGSHGGGESDNDAATGPECEEGGRLWKLIVEQTNNQDHPNDDNNQLRVVKLGNDDVTGKVIPVDPPATPIAHPKASSHSETFKLSGLLPGGDDDSIVDERKSRPYVYENATFSGVNDVLCAEEPEGLLCGSEDMAAVMPWRDEPKGALWSVLGKIRTGGASSKARRQNDASRPSRELVDSKPALSSTKNRVPSARKKAKRAVVNADARRCSASSTKDERRSSMSTAIHSKRQATSKTLERRDASPVDAGLYIAEMMGQELLQVASDLVSVCDEFTKSGDTRKSNQSWLRCW